MARGTTLTNLLAMLKAEIGDFSGTNTTRDAELSVLLSNKQQYLAGEYDWPFLQDQWDVAAPASTQFLTLPTILSGNPQTQTVAINLDRSVVVETLFNEFYTLVNEGIGSMEYNTLNFKLRNDTSDPIQRWRLASNVNEPNNANKFEVWPVPATAQTLRFTGQRVVQALATGSDTADLDDQMIVLFVAADRLLRSGSKDAQMKLQLAQRRLQWLRQNYPVRDVTRTMDGMGDAEFKRNRKLTGMTVIVK